MIGRFSGFGQDAVDALLKDIEHFLLTGSDNAIDEASGTLRIKLIYGDLASKQFAYDITLTVQ